MNLSENTRPYNGTYGRCTNLSENIPGYIMVCLGFIDAVLHCLMNLSENAWRYNNTYRHCKGIAKAL